MTNEERAALIAAVESIPDHHAGGYEWDWECCFRWRSKFQDCELDHPEHQHELISRDRVLTLLAGLS